MRKPKGGYGLIIIPSDMQYAVSSGKAFRMSISLSLDGLVRVICDLGVLCEINGKYMEHQISDWVI